MAGEWFDVTKIKVALKKAKSKPVPIAFGLGSSLDEGQLAMHAKRSPEFLGRALKKEGFKSSRIIVGTAEIQGSTLVVSSEKASTKAKVGIKHFLKKNPLPKLKVQLIEPGGKIDEEDDEDEQDTVELESEDPDEGKSGEWFNTGKIKVALKKAKSVPIPIAFGLGASLDEGQLAMHVKRSPEFLGRVLKKEGFKSSRIITGTAQVNGSMLVVTVEKVVSKAKVGIKHFLKVNPLPNLKVQVVGPGGVLVEEDDEDEDEQDITGAVPESPGEDKTVFLRRFAGLTPQVKKALTEQGADARSLGAMFKKAHELGKSGDYGRAMLLLDNLEQQLEGKPTQPQTDTLGAEWNKQLKSLAPQVKEVLTAKLEGSRDIGLKFKKAQGFGSKQDFESGIAELNEVSSMIEALTSGGDKNESEWTQRFKTLEPDLESALKQDLGDSSKLRAARDMAIEKAGSGDHVTALKILDRLQPAIMKALASIKPDSEDQQAPDEPTKKQANVDFTFSYRKALLEYAMAKDSVNGALRGFVSDTKAQLPEQASLASAIQDVIYELNEELYDEVDEALGGPAVDASDYYKSVKKVINDYRGLIRGHEVIKHLDKPPVALGIGNTLISALDKLDKTIAA